jgi:hypothetical protein
MRMSQLYDRAYVMDFTTQCVDNMELAAFLSSDA